jgi:hypothetical protein
VGTVGGGELGRRRRREDDGGARRKQLVHGRHAAVLTSVRVAPVTEELELAS